VDLAKVYDKVDWSFLKAVLTAFGFHHDWVKWIWILVSTTFFSRSQAFQNYLKFYNQMSRNQDIPFLRYWAGS
jgi:hypothetical protein